MIKFEDIERLNEIRMALNSLKYIQSLNHTSTIGTGSGICPAHNMPLPKEHADLAINSFKKSLIIELQSYGIQYKD